ncbi:MAG: hypothetical protein FJ106_05595 [Deltaproteobacteria bacterium]|nr:hypothetical protein [Deltaproteobacteria bacterium]
MTSSSLKGTWKIGTVMGIPIRIHFPRLIVFGLITRRRIARYIQIMGKQQGEGNTDPGNRIFSPQCAEIYQGWMPGIGTQESGRLID